MATFRLRKPASERVGERGIDTDSGRERERARRQGNTHFYSDSECASVCAEPVCLSARENASSRLDSQSVALLAHVQPEAQKERARSLHLVCPVCVCVCVLPHSNQNPSGGTRSCRRNSLASVGLRTFMRETRNAANEASGTRIAVAKNRK